MPMILLEGIDGAGKTSLAEQIIDRSPIPASYAHRGPMRDGVLTEYVLPIDRVTKDKLLVADRWHVGETIYGPIYRGWSMVAGFNLEFIEEELDYVNAVRCIIAPPLETVRYRLDTRGEDYLQPEHVTRVYSAYLDFAAKNNYEVITEVNESTADYLLRRALEGTRAHGQ